MKDIIAVVTIAMLTVITLGTTISALNYACRVFYTTNATYR